MFEKFTAEKSLIYVLIGAVLIVVIIIVYLFFAYGVESIKVIAPNGEEEWEIGQTHEITWKVRGIGKVGIVLFNGNKPEWIAENIDAKLGKYQWEIYQGHEYGDNFWVAVFEYPWQKGNKIDYSDKAFAISYPFLDSCDVLSIIEEWPYLASDFPEIRRVFITEDAFTGNLDGLVGADKICQQEAENQGLEGQWMAFIGGDSDEDLAVERLKRTPRGTEGIFISADSLFTLIRGATCHRLLGRTFDDFLAKLSDLAKVNQDKFEKGFLENMGNLWLGRLNEKSKRTCLAVGYEYSYTTTCQNWTNGTRNVEGESPYPKCYTPAGKSVSAIVLGGLASDLIGKDINAIFTPAQGKSCNTKQKLLCIEQ